MSTIKLQPAVKSTELHLKDPKHTPLTPVWYKMTKSNPKLSRSPQDHSVCCHQLWALIPVYKQTDVTYTVVGLPNNHHRLPPAILPGCNNPCSPPHIHLYGFLPSYSDKPLLPIATFWHIISLLKQQTSM